MHMPLAVRRLLSAACCPPLAVRRLLSAACCPPLAVRRLLSAACCPPLAVRRLLSAACCPPLAVRRLLSAACCPPLAVRLIWLLCTLPSFAQSVPQPVSMAVGTDGLTRLLWNNPDGNNDAALWRINADSSVTPITFGPYPGWTPTALAIDSNNASRILWNYTDRTMSLWKFNETTGTFTSANYGPYPGWTATSLGTGGNNIPRVMWTNTNGAMSLWTNADVSAAGPTFGPYPGYTASFLAVGSNNIPSVLWTNTNGTVSLWPNADTYATSPSYFNYPAVAGYTPLGMSNDAGGGLHILWNHPSDSTVSLWSIKYDGTYTAHSFPYPSGYAPKSLSAASLQVMAGPGGIVPQNSYMNLMWVNPTTGDVLIQTIAASGAVIASTPVSHIPGQNLPPVSHGTYTVTYSGGTGMIGSGGVPNAFTQSGNVYSASVTAYGGSDSGSVQCNGPLTATFTWVPAPGYPNSPPPSQVIVAQTCTSSWYVSGSAAGFTGSCSSGLGTQDGPLSGVQSDSVSGKSATIIANPGQRFVVSPACNPSAVISNPNSQCSGFNASVTYSAYIISPALTVDQDQQVFAPAPTTLLSATISNAPGLTVDWVEISVDGAVPIAATVTPGNPNNYFVYWTQTSGNPREHTIKATAQLHNATATILLNSTDSQGNGRPADDIVADVRLQSLKFNNNIPLMQNTTTPVPTPEFTWTSASNNPATSNPAAYIQGKSVNFTMLLGSSTGAALTASATMGYALKLQATPNTTNPTTHQADPALTLYDNTTGAPFTPTPCGSSTTIAATTVLDSWVAKYPTSFSALNLYVKFTQLPTPVWRQIETYASSSSPFGNNIYAVLATPTAPMSSPWVGVLDDACVWAARTTTATSATTALVTNEYNNAHYNGGKPAFTDPFTDTQETFHLSNFLSNTMPYPLYGQCNDLSDFLVCLSNAIGARPLKSQRSVSVAEYNAGSHFYTNPITAPPDQVAADAKPFPGGWAYHQWANDTGIFDACLRFGGVTAPIDMAGPAYGTTYNTDLVASYLHFFTPPALPSADWDPLAAFTPTIAN